MKKATRADVAREAGVSETVVSYVVNNNRYVAKEKRERVEMAIRKLQYNPNTAARAMKGKKTKQILFVVDSITDEYFGKLVNAMDTFAAKEDLLITLCGWRAVPGFVARIRSMQYDGIMIASPAVSGDAKADLVQSGIPILFFERNEGAEFLQEASFVDTGIYNGMRELARILKEKGKQSPVFLFRGEKKDMTDLRLCGFMAGCADVGIGFDQNRVFCVPDEDERRNDAVDIALHVYPAADIFVCYDDVTAAHVLHRMRETGYEKKIAVTGVDDSTLARALDITSLRLDTDAIAKEALQALLSLMDGEKPQRVCVSAHWITRKSL